MKNSDTNRTIESVYKDCKILLSTQHKKSLALCAPFNDILGAKIVEYETDTDELGTFSGEIERQGSMLDTAKRKCELSLTSQQTDYALASEGSFGPHPLMPFIPGNQEMLYFIDRKRGFELYVTDLFQQTNYAMTQVSSKEELDRFAEKARFPSHALILRAYPRQHNGVIYKGIQNQSDLEAAYFELLKHAEDRKVWVETDMRAHLNPTRMKMIGLLGEKLAHRLNSFCPCCDSPGWGKEKSIAGLPCSWCGTPTNEIKADLYRCAKCHHQEEKMPTHNLTVADPGNCPYCNP